MNIIDFSFDIAYELIHYVYLCNKRNNFCNEHEIISYIGKTKNYTKKTLDFLTEFNILICEGSTYKLYNIEIDSLNDDFESCKFWLKKRLISIKPFSEYIYFVSKKNSKEKSAKLVKSIYSLNLNETDISKIFEKWIKNINLDITIENNEIKKIKELEEATLNIVVATKFLKEEFGDKYSMISNNVILDLQKALINIKVDPEESINDVGRGLEDFLRIDLESSLNLSKCNGIGQIGNLFNQNNLFPTKLNNIAIGLASIRSMGKAHGVDKKENQRWKILQATAFSNFIITVSLMKSYLDSKDGKLIF